MASKSDKTAADIRMTAKRYRMPKGWAEQIDNCKRICSGWHNRFGACLVLDNDRLRSICRRLVDDGVTYDQAAWAVEAYSDYCKSDKWHQDHPEARKTLAAFFSGDRFEEWIQKGEQLRSRSKRRNIAEAASVSQREADARKAEADRAFQLEVMSWVDAKEADAYQRLLDAAIARLPGRIRVRLVNRSISNPLIFAQLCAIYRDSMTYNALHNPNETGVPHA